MHESHGASNIVIWEGVYTSTSGSPVTLVIQDVLSIQEKHNKLRIVVRQGDTEIFHFVNATQFLVFAFEFLNDIGSEHPFFYEFKGSPNLRASGHTARTIQFHVRKNQTVYLEIATGSGVIQEEHVVMGEVLNKVDLVMPSSEFKAICFKLINFSQAKLVVNMMGQINVNPKSIRRSNAPKRIPNQRN